MRAIVYFFHCLPQNAERYRIAAQQRGIDIEVIPIVENGFSSVYRAMAARERAASGSYLDGLLAHHVPQRLVHSAPDTVLVIASWSAGYGYPITLLEHMPDAERLDGLVFIDSCYAGMHADGSVKAEDLLGVVSFARRARREDGTQILWDGYADVPTCWWDGSRWRGYSSTQMVAEHLVEAANGERGGFRTQLFDMGGDARAEHVAAMLQWGPGWLTEALVQLRDRRVAAGLEPEPGEVPPVPMQRSTIRRGSRGPDVVAWQQHLIAEGYDLGQCAADGVFGARAELATKNYQLARGLVVDGVVGPQTWATVGQLSRA